MDHTSVQNGFVSLYYYFILWAFSWACLEWQMGWVYTSGTIPLAQLCQASSIKISQRVWKKTNAVWTQQFLRCMEVNREQGWCHDASLSASVCTWHRDNWHSKVLSELQYRQREHYKPRRRDVFPFKHLHLSLQQEGLCFNGSDKSVLCVWFPLSNKASDWAIQAFV